MLTRETVALKTRTEVLDKVMRTWAEYPEARISITGVFEYTGGGYTTSTETFEPETPAIRLFDYVNWLEEDYPMLISITSSVDRR